MATSHHKTSARKLLSGTLANGLLVLGAWTLCVLGLELALRLVAPEPPAGQVGPRDNEWRFFEYHELLGWKNRPGARGWFSIPDTRTWIEINTNGLRDPEHEPRVSRSSPTILVLGDSFTWGFGVERQDRYTDVLARLLAVESEIINAGVSGYGTDQELLYLETEGAVWHPDIVIVQFGLEDIVNNHHSIQYSYPKPYFRLEDGELARRNVPVPTRHVPWEARFEVPTEFQSRSVRPTRRPEPPPKTASPTRRLKLFLRRNLRSYGFVVDGSRRLWRLAVGEDTQPTPEDKSPVDRLTTAIFRRMREVAEANGAALAVVFVPYRQHLVEGVGDNTRAAYSRFFENTGIPCLDLWEPFRTEAARGTRLYFDIDPHWTPAGHALAADQLNRFLRNSGLFPVQSPAATAQAAFDG